MVGKEKSIRESVGGRREKRREGGRVLRNEGKKTGGKGGGVEKGNGVKKKRDGDVRKK